MHGLTEFCFNKLQFTISSKNGDGNFDVAWWYSAAIETYLAGCTWRPVWMSPHDKENFIHARPCNATYWHTFAPCHVKYIYRSQIRGDPADFWEFNYTLELQDWWYIWLDFCTWVNFILQCLIYFVLWKALSYLRETSLILTFFFKLALTCFNSSLFQYWGMNSLVLTNQMQWFPHKRKEEIKTISIFQSQHAAQPGFWLLRSCLWFRGPFTTVLWKCYSKVCQGA